MRVNRFLQGLGERVGIAGIAVVTVATALFGAAGCREGSAPASGPAPTCDEPAVWCHRGDAAEAVQR